MVRQVKTKPLRRVPRTKFLYAYILIVGIIFSLRLFQLQIVRGSEFSSLAISGQLKKYEIPAERGKIYLRDGDSKIPIVLNETKKILYADPRYVDNPRATAEKIARIIGGDVNEYAALMSDKNRVYVVLKRKLSLNQAKEIDKLELKGIGMQDMSVRFYPEGSLAAQLLGFVNDDGVGQYGVEGFLNDELSGRSGLLSAVTDARGIPLTSADNSVRLDPINGDDLVLTVDRAVQSFAEQALARGVKRAKGKSGSVIVLNPNNGEILAMANYPTYSPAKFNEVKDPALFLNGVVSRPYEVGSVIKPFTMSAGLNEGVVTPETKYFDKGYVQVDDRRIENAGASGGVERTMTEVIQKSVNTGAVFVLDQLSGGKGINQTGRDKLYSYFFDQWGFAQLTGVEQAAEAPGVIYSPDDPEGNNVRYANMTFGQGMSLTMVQVAAAFASLINGGTYYPPHLVYSKIDALTGNETVIDHQPLRQNIISQKTSEQIREMTRRVVLFGGGYSARRSGYIIGGKTGTAQKLNNDGTYSNYLEVGSFVGYGAGKTPQYLIMVKVDEPGIPGYAGTVAAAPIFAEISNWLIDYYRIPPVD